MRLNLFDYRESAKIAARDEPFAALVAAAMRRADTDNMTALSRAFPEIAADLKARYNAPGGFLPSEHRPDEEAADDEEGEYDVPIPLDADGDDLTY